MASVADVFDLGSAVGRASAVVATTDGGTAAFYNPGGLGFRDRPQLRVGFEWLHSELRLKNERVDIARPYGILIESATPVPLQGFLKDRLAVSATLYLNPESHLLVATPASATPTLPYYQNRTQRFMALVGLAARLHPNVSAGLAVNYFAGVRGQVQGSEGASGDLQANLHEEFYGHATLNAGLQARFDAVRAGLAYRAQFSVPVSTQSQIYVADSPLALNIQADALFCPETWVLGAAYRVGPVEAGVDLSWRRWSRYRSPYPQIDASVPRFGFAGDDQEAVKGVASTPRTRDIWRAAVFGDMTLADSLHLTAGFAYEPSPFRFDNGPANLVDGSKRVVALGLAYRAPTWGNLDWGLEAGLQAHWMAYRRLHKDPARLPDEDPSAPGRQTSNLGYPSIAGGGLALAAVVSLVVEWLPPEPRVSSTTEVSP